MTDPASIAAAVSSWFDREGQASLELPDGWFGRPYDNLHDLTWCGATDRKLLIELDGQILLIATLPKDVKVASPTESSNRNRLLISDCVQVSLDWQEYGDMRPHLDNHGAGTITLHGPLVVLDTPGGLIVDEHGQLGNNPE